MSGQTLHQVDDATNGSPEDIIRVGWLTKSYGRTVAIGNVGFSVRSGEIFGYLGPNGAGKTTTINSLSGLPPRDARELRVCGTDIDRDPVAVKQQIGVLPEESNLYPELTCRRNLEYLGERHGLSCASRRTKAAELPVEFDLADKAEAPFRALPRGRKRRLAEHNNRAHSPRKHTSRNPGPWHLIHHETYPTRAEAMRRERWLKSGVGRKWPASAVGGASPPQADQPLDSWSEVRRRIIRVQVGSEGV